MKQIFKKVSSLCTVLLMMAVLTLTGVSSVWAADEVDDTVKQTLVTTAEGLTDTIIALSDEDIENYTKSSDEFTVGAMTAWAGSKDEVGALKERTGETEVKASEYYHGYCNRIHRSYFPELPDLSVQIHPESGSKEKSSSCSSPCPCTGGSTSGSCRSRRYRTDRGYRSSNCSS